MSQTTLPMPPRLVDLKREIVSGDAETQARLVESWNELLMALAKQTQIIKEQGPDVRIFSMIMFRSFNHVNYLCLNSTSHKWSSPT